MTATPERLAMATPFVARIMLIRSVAVLGAGTMGSRIAALIANRGIPVLLLDMPGEGNGARNTLATSAIDALLKSKPPAFYEPGVSSLVTPGNFDDDLPKLVACDWVIEVVTENLAVKQALLTRVLRHLSPHAILSTNTSGLPVASIAQSLGDCLDPAARKRFFGTHFFNPPRYMRLVEVIPTPDTDPGVLNSFAAFADQILGKQVVQAHDTPNFVANRIGVSNLFSALNLRQQQGLTIEEVDALTGSSIGWPRTGTFRLADMVGIDILAHVASNFPEDSNNEAAIGLIRAMVDRNWLGDKTGQGFYKKSRNAQGMEDRFVLNLSGLNSASLASASLASASLASASSDPASPASASLDPVSLNPPIPDPPIPVPPIPVPTTLDYRPLAKAQLASLEMVKGVASLPERLRLLLANDVRKDKAAAFLWPLLANLWSYATDRIGEIADDAPSIDRAMEAGFNWELGPFAMLDACGLSNSVARMRKLGLHVSQRLLDMEANGITCWYSPDKTSCYSPLSSQMEPVTVIPGHARIQDFRTPRASAKGVIRKNAGASLVDLGQGIACIELHSPKSAIGNDVVSLITSTLTPDSAYVQDFQGFVIASDLENFSVGANLMQLLLAIQEAEWADVNLAIRSFQRMTAAIKFCPRPVVAAPFGLCLGGGTEIALHAAGRQLYVETFMGLVEAGIGLIPGGGGTKEMALRAHDAALAFAPPDPKDPVARFAQCGEYAAQLKRALEIIATAKVSTCAAEARTLALVSAQDRFTTNRERLLLDARAQAVLLAGQGYLPPVPRSQIPAAGSGCLAMLQTGIFLMGEAAYASDHDQVVARKIAHVLCGGNEVPGTPLSEQTFLDLEREAFLSLCGERKTQERIAFTLKTGKPLRN